MLLDRGVTRVLVVVLLLDVFHHLLVTNLFDQKVLLLHNPDSALHLLVIDDQVGPPSYPLEYVRRDSVEGIVVDLQLLDVELVLVGELLDDLGLLLLRQGAPLRDHWLEHDLLLVVLVHHRDQLEYHRPVLVELLPLPHCC